MSATAIVFGSVLVIVLFLLLVNVLIGVFAVLKRRATKSTTRRSGQLRRVVNRGPLSNQ
jgi:hypothetical protein